MHNIRPTEYSHFAGRFCMIIYSFAGSRFVLIRTATIARNGMSDIKYPRLQYRIQLMSRVQLVL